MYLKCTHHLVDANYAPRGYKVFITFVIDIFRDQASQVGAKWFELKKKKKERNWPVFSFLEVYCLGPW